MSSRCEIFKRFFLFILSLTEKWLQQLLHKLPLFHGDFHLKSYKYQNRLKLEVHDYDKRVKFANWALQLPLEANFFYCSEEALLSFFAFKQENNRIWAKSQPYIGIVTPFQYEKVLDWHTNMDHSSF